MLSIRNTLILFYSRKYMGDEDRVAKVKRVVAKLEADGVFEQPDEEPPTYAEQREDMVLRKRREYEAAGVEMFRTVRRRERPEPALETGRFGRTPLHEAVVNNDLEAVKSILSRGVGIDLKDNNDNTAYDIASIEEHHEIVAAFDEHYEREGRDGRLQ